MNPWIGEFDLIVLILFEYVNVYMTEDISVQDIADALNVSRYLIKKFMLLNREKITFFELAHWEIKGKCQLTDEERDWQWIS